MDHNSYYTCKCVYFDSATWANNTATAKPKNEPVIITKRWYIKGYYKQDQKKVLSKWLPYIMIKMNIFVHFNIGDV